MRALDRTLSVLGGLFLVISFTLLAGCASNSDGGSQASSADLTAVTDAAAPTAATLTDKVKAAYEDSVKNKKGYWIAGETGIAGDKLPGTAAADFANDADTSQGYGYGYPAARVATVDGKTIYAISGIVSDTGDILGFYDAKGNELCEAYSGQGEQPNANGVDWWK